MDFEQIARSLLPLLGGKENIASAAPAPCPGGRCQGGYDSYR